MRWVRLGLRVLLAGGAVRIVILLAAYSLGRSGVERRHLESTFFVFFVLAFLRFFVNLQEPVKLQDRASHSEPECLVARLCIDIDRRLIEHCRVHLRRHKTLPDQLIEFEQGWLQVSLDLFRVAQHGSGADGLMRFLCAHCASLVLRGLGGQKVIAVAPGDILARLVAGRVCDVG